MKCPICKSERQDSVKIVTCDYYKKSYHKECWKSNKECGTPVCTNLPVKENTNIEEEHTYYGEKTKKYSFCTEIIPISSEKCIFGNNLYYGTFYVSGGIYFAKILTDDYYENYIAGTGTFTVN